MYTQQDLEEKNHEFSTEATELNSRFENVLACSFVYPLPLLLSFWNKKLL